MRTDFITDIFNELEKLSEPNAAIPKGIIFPCLKLLNKEIYIQCIPFESYQQQHPDENYFSIKKDNPHVVITVWEDEWLNHREIILSRIKSMLTVRKRIHARATTIERIDKKTADLFLEQNHLQGSTSAYYKYGLKVGDELVAVATFGKSRIMTDGPVYYRSYELERYCSKLNITVTGGLGKLLQHFIKTHHAKHIMTYADAAWGKGESYLKLGFEWLGYGKPQHFYIINNKRYAANRLPLQIKEEQCLKVFNNGTIKYILDLREIGG